jgi:hypothetical protein
MSILAQLSSQLGNRSESANRSVAAQCLNDLGLLVEISRGLGSQHAALAGDCAEVMTQVAQQHPEWVAPYLPELAKLLSHKVSRVRWEAVHALAFAAVAVPEAIPALLPVLTRVISADASIIVRDYAVDVIANYASTGKAAAEEAYPILKGCLTLWEGRHAGHALKGLVNVALQAPALCGELQTLGEMYIQHEKGVVRKAAKDLLRTIKAA